MKLTDLMANPELLSTTSRKSKYQYNLSILGEKKVCSSHVEAVITTLQMLSDKKVIKLSDLEGVERYAGFNLLMDVSDVEESKIPEIMSTLAEGKLKSRYQVKMILKSGKEKYIVCNQWIPENADKFLNKMMNLANEKATGKKDLSTFERLKDGQVHVTDAK